MSVIPDLLTTRQAAQELGRSQRHVGDLLRQNRLQGQKRGRRWIIPRSALERYMAEWVTEQMPAELEDPEALKKLYQEAGTLRDLAERLGCCYSTVRRAALKHGIKLEARAPTPAPFEPEPVALERWEDLAPIYLARGLSPPRLKEMCPRNCPAWDDCLNTEGCAMAEGGNGKGAGSA